MRILVVEDDPDMSRFIARGLGEQSYAVDVAATGEAALEAATAAPYDAIILDAMIPPPDGFEVCRQLRAQSIDSTILMLTAHVSKAVIKAVVDAADSRSRNNRDYRDRGYVSPRVVIAAPYYYDPYYYYDPFWYRPSFSLNFGFGGFGYRGYRGGHFGGGYRGGHHR